MIQIYHNPRCGKSRAGLKQLQESGLKYEIINYLVDPPNFEELSEIIRKLKIKPLELVRQKEKIGIEKFKNHSMLDSEVIMAMVEYPILIERPILIKGDKAIIGRDALKLAVFLD